MFSDKKLDWTVLVYPTLKQEKSFFFGFNIDELHDFVNYKFNSLEKISENIKSKLDERKEG